MSDDVLRHATPSPWFRKGFAWWTAGMIRRSFDAWRLTPQCGEVLQQAHRHDGPLLVVANHNSWWDPLVGLRLAEVFFTGRPIAAPIEMHEYERFGVLKKLGLFGIVPEDERALPAMVEHARQRAVRDANLLFLITPQGRFVDPRAKVRLRPGAVAVAAVLPRVKVLAAGFEYPFWRDRRPEILVHAVDVTPPEKPSMSAWHRTLTRHLQAAVDELAPLAIAKDPAAFEPLPGERSSGSAINPVYDLWLKLRGIGTRIGENDSTQDHAAPAGRSA